MPKTRRAFTDEFKREAVKLVKQPWGEGHAHCKRLGYRAKRAEAMGQPGARRCHGHAAQQAFARRIGI